MALGKNYSVVVRVFRMVKIKFENAGIKQSGHQFHRRKTTARMAGAGGGGGGENVVAEGGREFLDVILHIVWFWDIGS